MRQTLAEHYGWTGAAMTYDPLKRDSSWQMVCPGIRTNSASGKFEVLVTKFVGNFDSLTAAKKARERFISKVAKVNA